jgi:hypothetical protein
MHSLLFAFLFLVAVCRHAVSVVRYFFARRSEEVHALHRSHVRLFGKVRAGLAVDTLHRDPSVRRRQVQRLVESLKVR